MNKNCCDKEKAAFMLKTCKGQIESVLKMISDERYCIDIVNQILAAEALLKKANKLVLKSHLENCVKESMKSPKEAEIKIQEIKIILEKFIK